MLLPLIDDVEFSKKIQELKTQKVLTNIGHSYATTYITPLYASKGNEQLITLPPYLANIFGFINKSKTESYDRLPLPIPIAQLLLLVNVILASLFPQLLVETNVKVEIAIFGRFVFMIIFQIPLVIKEFFFDSNAFMFELEILRKTHNIVAIFSQSCFQVTWCYLFGKSLNYTTINYSVIFSSLTLLIWFANKLFKKNGWATEREWFGLLLGVIGFTVIFSHAWIKKKDLQEEIDLESLTKSENPYEEPTWAIIPPYINANLLGELFAVMASVASAFFFGKNREINCEIPFYIKLTLISILCAISTQILLAIFDDIQYDFTDKTGILCIFNSENINSFLLLGGISVYGSFMLQNYLTNVCDSFILNSAFFTEILFTQFFAWYYGYNEFSIWVFLTCLLFIIPAKFFILMGIQQFEDKYEGGEIGIPINERDKMKIFHLKEIEGLNLSDTSFHYEEDPNGLEQIQLNNDLSDSNQILHRKVNFLRAQNAQGDESPTFVSLDGEDSMYHETNTHTSFGGLQLDYKKMITR